ncbi:MAG: CBS domain-containing protein [Armatimonadota bacterium]|nr:CBS domain-containing protein [Armatimonadota bacterium]
MAMLSQLRRLTLLDERQRRAPLRDLAVALLEGDYPPVTHLVFQNAEKQDVALPWQDVQSIDWQARQIQVADLAAAEPSRQALREEVLLHRDILDALIIDIQNRRVTRAGDLWLQEEDGRLWLRAADTSVHTLLRRISRGRFGRVNKDALYDWKYIEFLRGDPQAVAGGTAYHRRIVHLPPGEIARLTDPLPYLHAAELLTLLPDEIAADTLEVMQPQRQLQVFEEVEEEQGLRLLELMAPDLAADLVGRLETAAAHRYLNRLSKKQSKRLVELLRYPENTVGAIMTNDVVAIAGQHTVREARDVLRKQLQEPDFVYFIYVVDSEEMCKLRGVTTLRQVFIADDEQRIEEIMNSYVITLYALDAAEEAAYRVINSHLAALPVVGHEGQLLGAVTVDVAVAQVAPSSWTSQAPRVFS